MKIIFYSTNCPKCKILKTKLDSLGLSYETNTNIEEMLSLGIQSAPALSINGVLLDFGRAIKWIKEQHNAS